MKRKILTLSLLTIIAINAVAQDAAVKDLQAAAGKEVKSAEKDGW